MYPISDEIKALFDSENRQFIRITGTDKNGTAINITEANVMQGGFSIDRYSCNNTKLEIGTAVASEMTLKLDNRQGQFDNVYFEGTELYVEIGIADSDDSTTAAYWMPCGFFTPDEQPRKLSTITIHALDRMTRFDVVQDALMPWTDNNGNIITDNNGEPIYLCAEIAFPTSVKHAIEQMCYLCNVNLASNLDVRPNYDCVIEAMPEMQTTVTFRNLIQWCAGLMASNAWIDWNGELRFSWYDTGTGYVSTLENRFNSDVYENSIVVTGVQFADTDEDKTLYLAGRDTYTLDLTGNPLISGDTADYLLSGIYMTVRSYSYRPFSATVIPSPYLWPMDRVVFTDKNGEFFVTTITNINFTINGTTTIQAIGETTQTNSYASPGSFTSQQAAILQKMRRVINTDLNDAIDNATSLITGADRGFVRFIYDENDVLTEIVIMDTDDISTATKVWRWNSGGLGYSTNGYAGPYTLAMTQDGSIVADFITSGTLSANIVRAGILTDTDGYNYWDLDNGIFRLAGNTTLDGKPVTQLISEVNATISSVDVEFAQNQSTTVAPTDGWSTTAPAWAEGYYIWQRTKTVSPSGTSYSEPTCISGRDGSASTPGLNQATVYLYQRAATQPAKPNVQTTYVFLSGVLSPIPNNWYRSVPNGTDPCWITSAQAISTETMDTIPANEWLTPTKLVENGENGSTIESVVEHYAVSNTTTPPEDSAFWVPNVAIAWTNNYGSTIDSSSGDTIEFMPPAIPVPTKVDRYVWQYQLTTYSDGTSANSNKYISSVLGENGIGVSNIVEQYYLSTSDTTQIGGNWSEEQPEWSAGLFIWTRSVITWTDDEVTTTTPVLAKAINGANETANDATELANSAINNTNNLDASLNQTGVFNRLTNNGQVQGIFLENNQLYVNASYIKTGYLDAARIAAGSLSIAKFDTATQIAIASIDDAFVSGASVFYRSTTNTTPTISASTNITTHVDTSNEWTYVMPQPKNGCYFFTCDRYVHVDDSVSFSTVRSIPNANYTSMWCSENDATYIDGANIYTGSITSDQIATGTITIQNFSDDAQDSIVRSSSSKTQYYLSSSSASAVGGSWSDTVPQWTSGKYMWTRTVTTYTFINGQSATSYSTAVYDYNLTSALETGVSATASASNAQTTANDAVYQEQTIYHSAASGTTSYSPYTNWVTDATGSQNRWTQKRPVYSRQYPVLFVAVQRQTMAQSTSGGGYSCSCTTPVIDQTTTVIDGGHITTGTIDAGVVNVTNINASNISTGTLHAGMIQSSQNEWCYWNLETGEFRVEGLNDSTYCIYIDPSDGKAEINASYIKTGTLDASIITVTNLSASSINTGTMSANYINGGQLTLGGSGNTNGVLSVLDSNSNRVVYMDNSGAAIKGSLSAYGNDQAGNQISAVIENGMASFRFGSSEKLQIGYEESQQTFAIRPGSSSQDVSITAYTYNSDGSVRGGSSIRTYNYGTIALTCNGITLTRAGEVGVYTGKNVTLNIGNGHTLTFTEGILTNYT